MSEQDSQTETYAVEERIPTPTEFVALRDATGLPPRSREGVERGLPNSVFGVVVVHEPTQETVGMGRIVGDGGTVFQIGDMAVHPDHQRQGLGAKIIEALLAYLDREAPPDSYVNLVADVDGFYEQFGFEEVRPDSKGMYLRTE